MTVKRIASALSLFVLLIQLYGCASINTFSVDNKSVVFNSINGKIEMFWVDLPSFKALGGGFAKDKNRVYFGEKTIPSADPANFSVIEFGIRKDQKTVYFGTQRCADCDVTTFRKVEHGWYVDRNAAYSPVGNRRLQPSDLASFKPLNKWFSKDRHSVYLNEKIITGADAGTFKLGACGICEVCGEDKNICYQWEHPVPCD